jgi:hypothetical protein
MTIQRYLTDCIVADLAKKMVFLGGPRQVGKTTLGKTLVADRFAHPAYFNWDSREDRKRIINAEWPGDADLIMLDEVHKYRKWKSHLKGEYDTLKDRYRFLVTGSARMDVYRKGGDSLQGRYHYYRLHPFTLAEAAGSGSVPDVFSELRIGTQDRFDDLVALDRFGGFPEPFTEQDDRTLCRWHNERIERFFREDVRDLERIIDLGSMKLLGDMLPERVGSLISINSLREDLGVSHRAVSHWLDVLESMYYCYRIYPFAKSRTRSIKKEPKLYLWDWSEVDDEAARFENLVASHLLKLVHLLYDREGRHAELWFLRNVDKKEVDFLVTIDQKPWFAVEVKLNDTAVSPNLHYYRERMNIPFLYQAVKKKGVDILSSGVRVVSADRLLAGLV